MPITIFNSPIGPLLLEVDGQRRLTRLEFHATGTGKSPETAEVERQLCEYFAGERTSFDLELAPQGTPFQRDVWNALLTIPYGETRSYGQIAGQIGRPSASRAVGAANGSNPIAIVVPCHRVIGANGSLTGFGGGLPVKKQLLDLEARAGSLF